MSTALLREFTRFGMTGVASLLAYLLFSNLFHLLGASVWYATAFAWVLAALVSYWGHIHFTYRVTAEHGRMSVRFAVMLLIHCLLTIGITFALADLLGLQYWLTTILTVCTTPIVTYPLGKLWVFKERPQKTLHDKSVLSKNS